MIGATATLSITFTSWWLGGTGGSGKGDLDVVAYRDQWGCPALPMTQIKGTLRETADRFWGNDKVLDWFGSEGSNGQSSLRLSGDASLPEDQAQWFNANQAERSTLFSAIRSTALTDGVAKSDTLRTIEVAIPCTISRSITWVGDNEPEKWWKDIDQLCALTLAFGRFKNDGIGRAIAKCAGPQ
jgi:CRISPR/Cas system CSM-associated protein Csm3 (group 7 of RAMP superfamily)